MAGARTRPRRVWLWRLLGVLAVLLAHLLLLDSVARASLGWGQGAPRPAPMEVAFVKALAQSAPPAAPAPLVAAPPALAPARLPALSRAAASAPVRPASAPGQVRAEPVPPAPAVANAQAVVVPPERLALRLAAAAVAQQANGTDGLEPLIAWAAGGLAPPAQAVDAVPASAASAALAAEPSPEPGPPAPASGAAPSAATATATATAVFSWPPSTQLRYRLQGNYRGPVEGRASVEWVRQGQRYQVRMDSSAGPLFSRRAVSDGLLTDAGLQPQQFSAEQRILFSSRQWLMRFGPQWVALQGGRNVPTLAGVQDEASQFVQLTWLFTTQPQRLRVGQSVQLPLAIGQRLQVWTFDVLAEETLALPFGDVPTFHVKPRGQPAPGDMAAEMWFAPTLQYLPVRILIRQASGHWVDLTLAEPPLQAAEPAAPR